MPIALDGWTPPERGALFVVSGPSGVGKSTLVRAALDRLPGLSFSVSATTRAPRPGERDGVDYRFLSREDFLALRDSGGLLEWAEVYGELYGTPRAPVEAALSAGRSLLLDIDVQGARQVRAALPEAVSIFVLPPSLEALERRLRGRGEREELVRRRMDQAQLQLDACGEFDYLLLNDHLETARDLFLAVVLAELSRRSRRDGWVRRFTGS